MGKSAAKKSEGKKASPNQKLEVLGKKAEELSADISKVRQGIYKNESRLRKKISEKVKAESKLNALLKAGFSRERAKLSRIKSGSARKQANLKKKIAALEAITRIYSEKKARLREAKKKQAALKRQFESLERQAGEWEHA